MVSSPYLCGNGERRWEAVRKLPTTRTVPERLTRANQVSVFFVAKTGNKLDTLAGFDEKSTLIIRRGER